MYLPLFHVNAFTDRPFAGNPAAVCPLAGWLDDAILQGVAAENNLSETAYFVPNGDSYELRWFSPRCEIKLCGHATLAAAFVLLEIMGGNKCDKNFDSVRFETRFRGAITVRRDGNVLAMDFPNLAPWPCEVPPAALLEGLEKPPASVVRIEDDYFAVYNSEEEIRNICPNLRLLEQLHPFGVGITAPGESCDFVSRFFVPSYGIPEDAVTGSAHCSLAPYWAQRLGKTSLHARQLSERGGEVWCEVREERVILKGNAVLTLRGEMTI